MRAVVVVVAALLTGCFYIDPIITRPGAYIVLPGGNIAPRDSRVVATGMFDDARRHGTFSWHAFACAPADQGPNQGAMLCDDTELPSAALDQLDLKVPVVTAGGQLVAQILVKLEAHDDRGALATAEEPITVTDSPPSVDFVVSARSYTVGVPVAVFAKYSDPELPYERVDLTTAITWQVTPDTALADLAVAPPAIPDRTSVTVGKRLVPQQAGDFVVTAVASDPSHSATMPVSHTFHVNEDQPPCLAQWSPIVPADGQTLPISDPTAFQVPLVTDDRDAYPRLSDEPEFGTAAFAWSILPPGAAQRQTLVGATGNRFAFDPDAFNPGDLVEIRVEIFDRHNTPVTCDDSAPTCAITADPTCLQRQTWHIEVR